MRFYRSHCCFVSALLYCRQCRNSNHLVHVYSKPEEINASLKSTLKSLFLCQQGGSICSDNGQSADDTKQLFAVKKNSIFNIKCEVVPVEVSCICLSVFFNGPTLLYFEIINLGTVSMLSYDGTAVHSFRESLCTDILVN